MTWTLAMDVSQFQNTPDWATVVKNPPAWVQQMVDQEVLSPLQAVWIRIGQGNQLDTQFERNWQEAQAQNLRVGAYYVAIPGTDNATDPTGDAQAANARVWDWLAQGGGLQGSQMGVALDWEINPHKAPVAYLQRWGVKWCQDVASTVKDPKHHATIYSYQSWWQAYGWALTADERFWAAHLVPPTTQNLMVRNVPHWPQTQAADTGFWQFGQMAWPGITGNVVDVDVFLGDPATFATSFGWTEPTATQPNPAPVVAPGQPASPAPALTAADRATLRANLSQAEALLTQSLTLIEPS